MPRCSPIATACVSSPKDGLSSQARTCSRRWSFLLALPHFGAPIIIWTVHQQECKTQIATTSRRETMFAARDSTHTSRSPGRPQRANARLKNPRSVNWRSSLRTRASCCYMLAKRVFYAPPGALAEYFDSSRMNWKVRFHSHGSSLMIDSNTQKQQSGTLFEPQKKSMRQ